MKVKQLPCAVLAAAILGFPETGAGADEKLPNDSRALLAKLATFEAAEKKKFDEVVREKRAEVIKVLETHLERETKSGNLEAAVGIREKIRLLSPAAESGKTDSRPIPAEAKRFRSGGSYLIVEQPGGMSYLEAAKLAREKGGEVFAPRTKRELDAMQDIVGRLRCWLGFRYDEATGQLIRNDGSDEKVDPRDLGIEKVVFNPANSGFQVFLSTNGTGGFQVARREPSVKSAVTAVMIFFESNP